MIQLKEAFWIFKIQFNGEIHDPAYWWEVKEICGETGFCQDDEPELYSKKTWKTKLAAKRHLLKVIRKNGTHNYKILKEK